MLEELRRFILVAKNGNLTNTAEQIFITQSALTQSIQRLEIELKTKLFIRKAKTLQLTKEGAAVVEIGTKILELWDKAKNPSERMNQLPTYAIGLFDSAALRLSKYFIQNSTNKFFTLELTISSSGKLLSQLQLGTIDIAICVLDKINPLPKDIVLIKSFSEELIPVAAVTFKDKHNKIPFILYNLGSNTRQQIDEIFANYNIQPSVFAQSTSVSFMKELTAMGSGVALLPQSYIEADLKQGILKKQKLPLKFHREFGIFIQKNGHVQIDDKIIKDLIKNLE